MIAAQAKNDAQRRRAQISAIHVAKSQLQLDDETYRALIARVSAEHGTAVSSSADLTAKQRTAVLDELRRLGAKGPAKGKGRRVGQYPGKPANFAQLPEMITKIEAQLADMKLPWSYADAIAKRMHQVDFVAWCKAPSQLRDIIAALHVEQKKRRLNASIDDRLKALGWSDADAVSTLNLPTRWRHQVKLLMRTNELLGLAMDAT